MSPAPMIGLLAMSATHRLEALGQLLAINAGALGLLLLIIWTIFRLTMPGEEKILTDAFRKHQG